MRDRMKGIVRQFKVSKETKETKINPKEVADEIESKIEKNVEVFETNKAEGHTLKAVTVKPELLKQLKEVKIDRAPSVHIFYYPWYDSENFNNGTWQHWNHEYLPNWDKSDKHVYPTGHHQPPEDVGSLFYPSLGPYSSRDPLVIDQHMKWMSSAGIDVVVVSWLPEKKSNPECK